MSKLVKLIYKTLWTFIVCGNLIAATVGGSFSTPSQLNGTIITLSNRSQVFTATVTSSGSFNFLEVVAGEYNISLSPNSGYVLKQSSIVKVLSYTDFVQLGNVSIEKYTVSGSNYSYVWSQDQTYAGTEAVTNIVAPTTVTLFNKVYNASDIGYAEKLRSKYNIILTDANKPWSSEHAYRLFSILDLIPYTDTNPYQFNSSSAPTVWKLTNDFLDQDIILETVDKVTTVTVSVHAFTYATPFVAQIENKKGLYFSKRLHKAILRFVTNNGTDSNLMENILQKRFGVSTRVQDYFLLTGEVSGRFQSFKPNELLQIINAFEELPEGIHVISSLKYIIRRLDGTVNENYPEAIALAIGTYIEFMEKAFAAVNEIDVQRLVLHEKGHFVYGSVISSSLRDSWHKLGGWTIDSNGLWTTTKTTEFVSAYSHSKNPNEDFAETLAAFVTNPDILKARSTAKYEFFRDAIMFGNSYVSQIRQDLTFEVLNLFPNYNYPGKIKRVQVSVTGLPEEDKVITCEMELQPVGPKDNPVSGIYMRVFGPKSLENPVAPYIDWWLSPVSAGSNILRGSVTVSKYSRQGYWAPDEIVIGDTVGNQRYERAVLYGWRCYIDNPLQDLSPPRYVANSVKMYMKPSVVDGVSVQILSFDWNVNDDRGLFGYFSSVRPPGENQYSIYAWGGSFNGNGTAHTEYIITEFYPSGIYRASQLMMKDYGMNVIYGYFSDSGGGMDGTNIKIDEAPASISITTSNPDYNPPELDINRISISATPTVPDSPNGETQVVLKYFAKDNKSGVGAVSFKLRDPQGIEHYYYHYHDNYYTTFFKGNPTEWKEYTATVLLPVGSVAGTWGLVCIDLKDKALNYKSYSFVEIVRFQFGTNYISPTFALQPSSQTLTASGGNVTFSVGVTGSPMPTYQWYFNGSSISGATNSTLTITNVQTSSVGNYWATATNAGGTVNSSVASLSISQPGNLAFHSVVGSGYVAGLPLTIKNTISYTGNPSYVSWSVLLPEGWSFVSSSGNVGSQGPKFLQTSSLDWTWTNVSSGSITFTYTVMAPPSSTGNQKFISLVGINNGTNLQFLANPDPLVISGMSLPNSAIHSADINGDNRISLMELTRVIELYNTRQGPIRTGAYITKTGTDDGFETDTSRSTDLTMPFYHSADSNKDGKISLNELTRIIELYNYRLGSVRTGQYRRQSGTEDGFSAGP